VCVCVCVCIIYRYIRVCIMHITFYLYHLGFVNHLFLVLMMVFWMLNIFHIFLRVTFPLQTKYYIEKRLSLLHVIEVAGSFILCSVAPIIYVSTSQYEMTRFPPLLCVPTEEFYFYTLSLPLCFTLTIGINLLIVTLWKIHQASQCVK